ncbi:MAG: gamma-glutamyl-gamma-aminobutyrate hydrolase family protein [Thermodesulfobacteriota bacterium]
MRPVIGITADCNLGPPAEDGEKVPVTGYCLRPTYINAVSQVGGLALILPINLEKDVLEQMGEMIQGLLISGGGHDVDPRLYGESKMAELGRINQERTGFELAIARIVLEMGKPILGICNGLQVINVAAGGSLHQDIASQIKGSLPHRQSSPRNEIAHDVFILPGSRLREIIGAERIEVNSLHHQAVKGLGEGFQVNAVAADGVIEGIEKTGSHFVMGVQWHPEDLCTIDPKMESLFSSFIASTCQGI